MVQAVKRKDGSRRSICKIAFPVLVGMFLITMSLRSRSVLEKGLQSVLEKPMMACRENPYAASFHSSLDSIRSKADTWLANIDHHLQKASTEDMKEHSWARFFPFDTMAECDSTCVGGECRQDTSKIICGIDKLQTEEKCIVYSVGGDNQWDFELDILAKTPCEVHTFDCTGDTTRFNKPNHPRLKFHHICLGAEHVPYDHDTVCKGIDVICGDILTLYQIQTMLGHKRIDLFKMDIEGYEWPIFESWPELGDTSQAADMVLPMQVLVEVHYRTQMENLWPQSKWRSDFKSATDMVRLQEHLLKAGYAVGFRDDNRRCPHCTELTLVRYQCHH
jgi:hypothetical protein